MTQISPDYTFGRKVMRNHVEVGTPKRFGCSPDDLLHGLYQSSVEALMSNTFSARNTSFVTEEQFVVLNLVRAGKTKTMQGSLDWYDEVHIVCVAINRQKTNLIVVGDAKFLKSSAFYWNKFVRFIEKYQPHYRHSEPEIRALEPVRCHTQVDKLSTNINTLFFHFVRV